MDSAKSVHYKFKIDLAQKMREVIADVVRVTIRLFLLLLIIFIVRLIRSCLISNWQSLSV